MDHLVSVNKVLVFFIAMKHTHIHTPLMILKSSSILMLT